MFFYFCVYSNTHDQSNLGCIHHHIHQSGPDISHNRIASTLKRNYVRIRDVSLATITSDQFMHFAFDDKINHKINHNSSEMAFKRGFEHLMKKGTTGFQNTQSSMEFDEFESNRKVKEISSLMSEKVWQVFYTVTTNYSLTPCLAMVFVAFKVASQYGLDSDKLNDPLLHELHEHCRDFVEHDVDTCKNYCENHVHLINRIHDRTM